MYRTSLIIVAVSVAPHLVASAKPAVAAPQYSIVALDVLPGGFDSAAHGLNDVGQVVGASLLNRFGNIGQSRPVVWDYAGHPTELWSEQGIGGEALDVNNASTIVGRYGSGSGIPLPSPGVPAGRAFVWTPTSGRLDLGLQPFGNSTAVAINENGQVVGTAEILDPISFAVTAIHPFIWDPTTGIHDLGTLGGNAAFATDINAQGQVVGYSENADGRTRAFVWDNVTGMHQLPSIAGGGTQALVINDLGQVLGGEVGVGGLIWDLPSGGVTITPGGLDLNNYGKVVGGGSVGAPTIWHGINGSQLLSDLIPVGTGWELEFASALNETGDIVGYGLLHGQIRGFLMTPVPEPSSILLFANAGLWTYCVMVHRPRHIYPVMV